MHEQRALIVEDHPQVTYTVRPLLTELGLLVDAAKNLKIAEAKLEKKKYDLIILDRTLPDGDSFDLLKRIEDSTTDTKVLILSASSTPDQRVRGLQLGADDYLAKPFYPPELRARCMRLLMRSKRIPVIKVRISKHLVYDPIQQVLWWKKKKRRFTHREADLLQLFLKHLRRTIKNEYLLDHMWSIEKSPTLAAVHVRVARLRSHLKGMPLEIHSVYGIGYVMKYDS